MAQCKEEYIYVCVYIHIYCIYKCVLFLILSNVFQELHTTEKTKLITQLRDAKNLIEQLEQDKVG